MLQCKDSLEQVEKDDKNKPITCLNRLSSAENEECVLKIELENFYELERLLYQFNHRPHKQNKRCNLTEL